MAWINDAIYADPKAQKLTAEAFQVWVYAIAFCNHWKREDGRIETSDFRAIRANKKLVTELVRHRFLHEENGGWVINDFAEHNAARIRKRRVDLERWHARKGQTNGEIL